jgi:hypothetical protein
MQIKLHSQWHEPLGRIAFAKCEIEPQRTEFLLKKLILFLNLIYFNLVPIKGHIIEHVTCIN